MLQSYGICECKVNWLSKIGGLWAYTLEGINKSWDTMCLNKVLLRRCWQLAFIVGRSPQGKAGKEETRSFRLHREGKPNIAHPSYHFISRQIMLAKIFKMKTNAQEISNVQILGLCHLVPKCSRQLDCGNETYIKGKI